MTEAQDFVRLVQVLSGQINILGGTISQITETVNIQGSTNSAITNKFVPANSLVLIGTDTITITNLANGANIGQQAFYGTTGYYDGLIFAFTLGTASTNQYSVDAAGKAGWWETVQGTQNETWETMITNSGDGSGIRVVTFDRPCLVNEAVFTITNKSGVTVANDTINLSIFGIVAQTTVNNPTGTPVYNLPSVGSFDSTANFENLSIQANTYYTILNASSGGYVKKLNLNMVRTTFTNTVPGNLFVYNGSGNPIACFALPYNGMSTSNPLYYQNGIQLDLGDGIVNNGITFEISTGAAIPANEFEVVGTITYTQNTARPHTATIA